MKSYQDLFPDTFAKSAKAAFNQAMFEFCHTLIVNRLSKRVQATTTPIFNFPSLYTLNDWTFWLLCDLLPRHIKEIRELDSQPPHLDLFEFDAFLQTCLGKLQGGCFDPENRSFSAFVQVFAIEHLQAVSERLNLTAIADDVVDGLLADDGYQL